MKLQKPNSWHILCFGDSISCFLVVLEPLDDYEQLDINHDAMLIIFFEHDQTLARIVSPEAN